MHAIRRIIDDSQLSRSTQLLIVVAAFLWEF